MRAVNFNWASPGERFKKPLFPEAGKVRAVTL